MTTTELSKALPEIITEQVPGPKSKALLDRRDAAIPKALCGKAYPICIKQGGGAMFEDLDGNKFLDWVGGVGVLNIGYSNPEVIEAVKAQTEKYFHTIFNVYVHDGYVSLAEKLNEIMPCKGDVKKTYLPTLVLNVMKMQLRLPKHLQRETELSALQVLSTEELILQWRLQPRRYMQ